MICVDRLSTERLCGYVAVLSNYRKLLHRLEQAQIYEQQQSMSDEPGKHFKIPVGNSALLLSPTKSQLPRISTCSKVGLVMKHMDAGSYSSNNSVHYRVVILLTVHLCM